VCADEPLVAHILMEFPARELTCSRQPSPETILNLLNPNLSFIKPTCARQTYTIIQYLCYWYMFRRNSDIFRHSLRLIKDDGVPYILKRSTFLFEPSRYVSYKNQMKGYLTQLNISMKLLNSCNIRTTYIDFS
jgi:hypothetical protein